MMKINFDVVLFLLVAVINCGLAFLVISKNRKSAINFALGITALSIGVWVFVWAIAFSVTDISAKLFWTKLMHLGPAIVSPSFLYFSIVFPNDRIKIALKWLIIFFILPTLLSQRYPS